jgi:tripartite motif-containing protein 71
MILDTGTSVPVSTSISKGVLKLNVADGSGSYQYPIVVDPGVIGKDTQLTGNGAPTNWYFCMKNVSEACTQKTETLSPFHTSGWGGTEGLSDEATGEYNAGAYAEFRYKTQGESKIFEVTTSTEATNNANPGSNIESSILLKNETGTINNSYLFSTENYSAPEHTLSECTNCTPIENHNSVVFQQDATAAGTRFHDRMSSASVRIEQEVKPTITYDTTDEHFVIGGHEYVNILAGKGAWLGPNSGALGFTIQEKGIGVSHFSFSQYVTGEGLFYEQNLIPEGKCFGVQCPQSIKQEVTYNSKMENGENMVFVDTKNAAEGFENLGVKIKVDNAPPRGLELTGLPSSGVINEAQYHLQAQATDGSGTTPSSGIKSIALYLDGYEVAGKSGSCTPGPCTSTGEWTINGEAFGAGKHTLTVQATDNAGNVETKPYSITVRHASSLPVGPGSIDPITGALHLGASDVAVSGGIGSLGVSRSYNSRQLTAGEQGSLGPQWSLNISGARGVEREPTGSVVLIGSDGVRTTFESNGKGGYISPKGDENLVLEAEKEGETIKAYLLKDPAAGTTVKYTQPGGAGPWVIASSEGTLSKTNGGKETVEWERVENVTRPKLALAPVAAGVKCSPTVKEPKELAVGCRALSFTYATETTATGEAPSEWKAYKGRLMTVSFTAYNPSIKAMETKAVAEYAYDKQGRLRAEWDPRITPSPLKTTYGYDSEGHIVAVNPPGGEPWLFHYGTTASDTSAGRLLSVTRPPAGTAAQVKEQDEKAAPVNTAVPTLSSTKPAVGTKIAVSSNGTWSNAPLAYNYQWEDCNSSGKECAAIPGAVNQAYYPAKSDEGHTLIAQVIAVNATGAVSAASAATSVVASGTPYSPLPEPPTLGTSYVTTIDYNVSLWGEGAPDTTAKNGAEEKAEREKWGQTDDPAEPVPGQSLATAVFPPDEPMGWPAKDYKRATITYLDELGRTVNRASPSGGIATSEYNETNEVIRSLSADNRAAALKESKSREASELLDTKSKYNGETTAEKEKEEKEEAVEPGTRLLEVRGPQHTVKLASGSEVKARAHVHYYYDEGAPGGERYDLVTKTTDGAEYEGKEADVRTSTTSYSGQKNLGWLLRKPTSVTTDPNGLKLVHTTFYDSTTGEVIETHSPAAGAGSLAAGEYFYTSQVSTAGTTPETPIPMSKPSGVAVDSEGHVWVADTESNRVDEFSSTGEFIKRFGTVGSGNGQFKEPEGIAVDSEGHVWVADTGNDRVQEFSSKWEFIRAFGKEGTENGQFKRPVALTVDSSGNVWVADDGNNRVQEFSSTGTYTRQASSGFGSPAGIAADSKGDVWVACDLGTEVVELSATGEKLGSFGKQGKGNGEFSNAQGIAIKGETAYVVDSGNARVQEFKLGEHGAGEYVAEFGNSGSGNGQFKEPKGIAIDKEGNVWVADRGNNRVQELSGAGKYIRQLTMAGSIPGEPIPMSKPSGVAVDSEGHVWVADTESNRVDEFSSTGEFIKRFGTEGGGNGQFRVPRGIAVDSEGHVWVADTGNDRVQEFSSKGEFIRVFGAEGKENGQFKRPVALTIDSSGNVWVVDAENSRVQEFSSTGTYTRQVTGLGLPEGIAADPKGDVWVSSGLFSAVYEISSTGEKLGSFGKGGEGNGEFSDPQGITIKGETAYVVDWGNSRVQEFKLGEHGAGEYVGQFGSAGSGNGQFKEPKGIAIDKEGNVWVADRGNNRIQKFIPTPASPHAMQTIYYRAGAYLTYPSCGLHPEWANLPCRSQLAIQPAKGDPLPGVTDTYNMWDEPETVEEAFGSTTRTKKLTYDAAGRALTSEETTTGSSDTAVPKVTSEYSSETGVMVKQSTTVGTTTKTIKSVYDTLGQLTEYTDADSNTTQYVYSGPANDGRVEEVNYGSKKGSQMYSYDPTTKALTKLLDVGPEGGKGAGTFTASYDVEGKMTSETYPNGMTSKPAFNPAGETTGIEYEKTVHCASTCPEVWFKETTLPSIHGEGLVRTSTLAKEEYAYDNAGRLTKVNETPVGKGCKTRIYAYNEDSDRTSETTRESATETCATSGGTEEKHTYDEADRLIDTGVEYEAFGNQTKISAADAGEHEITASFYADNQVAVQKQNGETTSYAYDPGGRTEKTVSEGTTKATVVNHYPGPGEAISWTCEETAKECEEGKGTKWTRNIPGIDGSLGAVEKSGQAAVLQLHDLEGNVVATAAVTETETKLLTTYNPTEFGVPVNGTPPTKYSWLGASGYTPEQSSGAANPGGGSYVPQLGRPLQTQPVAPPGAPDGTYVNPYIGSAGSAADFSGDTAYAAGAPGREAARLAAARKFAEEEEQRALERAELEARLNAPTPTEGGAEEAGGSDPYEVLTGKQALGLAGKFNSESLRYSADAAICGKAGNITCQTKNELVAQIYGEGAEELEGCYSGVHHGRHNKYHEYENGVCWISWEIAIGGDPTNLGVEQCWSGSGAFGRYGLNEWYCPGHGWNPLRKII